jgi:hypothetical protein
MPGHLTEADKIKPENQPSAQGRTTRPPKEHDATAD